MILGDTDSEDEDDLDIDGLDVSSQKRFTSTNALPGLLPIGPGALTADIMDVVDVDEDETSVGLGVPEPAALPISLGVSHTSTASVDTVVLAETPQTTPDLATESATDPELTKRESMVRFAGAPTIDTYMDDDLSLSEDSEEEFTDLSLLESDFVEIPGENAKVRQDRLAKHKQIIERRKKKAESDQRRRLRSKRRYDALKKRHREMEKRLLTIEAILTSTIGSIDETSMDRSLMDGAGTRGSMSVSQSRGTPFLHASMPSRSRVLDLISGHPGIGLLTQASTASAYTPSVDSAKRDLEYGITLLTSEPLLESLKYDAGIPSLGIDREKHAIKNALKLCKTRTFFVHRHATVDNLRMTTTLGSRIIHYAGHGMPKHLLFEDGNNPGLAKEVSPKNLRGLLMAGGSGGFTLVFVSACHSEDSARAFIDAGAKHVICVTREQALSDVCAKDFTHQFYSSLVAGKTLTDAFDVACKTIEVKYSRDHFLRMEWKKFRLLPEDGDHNVTLFDQTSSSDGKMGIKDCTAPLPSSIVTPPPAVWVGRYFDTYQLMQSVLETQLTFLHGPKSSGKSAIVSRACTYLLSRRFFRSGVFVFDIYAMLEQNPDRTLAYLIYSKVNAMLKKRSVSARSARSTRTMNTDTLCRELNEWTKKSDSIEFLFVFEDVSKFHMEGLPTDQRIDLLVKSIVSLCPRAHVLLTLGTEPDFVDVFAELSDKTRHVHELKGMSETESVELFNTSIKSVEGKESKTLAQSTEDDIERICKQCHGLPTLLLRASTFLIEIRKRRTPVRNRRKMVIEMIQPIRSRLQNHKYYLKASSETLNFGDLSSKLKQKEAREFWTEHFPSATRGSWIRIRDFLKTRYLTHVRGSHHMKRPLQLDYPGFPDHEFITTELLPHLAQQTKTKYCIPVEDASLEDERESHASSSGTRSVGVLDTPGTDLKRKKKGMFGFLKSKSSAMEEDLDGDHKEDAKEAAEIAIELFGELWYWWSQFMSVIGDRAVAPFYFTDAPHVIAGLFSTEKAQAVLSAKGVEKGTAIIKFSKTRPGALVVMVNQGIRKKTKQVKFSKHIIYVDITQQRTQFILQLSPTKSDTVHSLYEVIEVCTMIKGVWCLDRANQPAVIVRQEVLNKLRARRHHAS